MIAVDTNILVYAHREESPWNASAHSALRRLWTGTAPWMVPWPCLHEFYCVVTHPKVHEPPTPVATALQQIDYWLQSPSVVTGSEHGRYWPTLRVLLEASTVVGAMTYDARIAAICLENGVDTLWTADRDFGRFPALHCENPLVARK